jgi:hypothetical protein
MKVSELIDQLKDLPPDTLVYVWNDGERVEISMIDDSLLEDQFIDINTVPPVGMGHKSIFVVANHNGTELGQFDTYVRAVSEANFYREQTGNPAYIEEQLA